jgi:hypothetical protein
MPLMFRFDFYTSWLLRFFPVSHVHLHHRPTEYFFLWLDISHVLMFTKHLHRFCKKTPRSKCFKDTNFLFVNLYLESFQFLAWHRKCRQIFVFGYTRNWEFCVTNLEKMRLFCIGNGAEFRTSTTGWKSPDSTE